MNCSALLMEAGGGAFFAGGAMMIDALSADPSVPFPPFLSFPLSLPLEAERHTDEAEGCGESQDDGGARMMLDDIAATMATARKTLDAIAGDEMMAGAKATEAAAPPPVEDRKATRQKKSNNNNKRKAAATTERGEKFKRLRQFKTTAQWEAARNECKLRGGRALKAYEEMYWLQGKRGKEEEVCNESVNVRECGPSGKKKHILRFVYAPKADKKARMRSEADEERELARLEALSLKELPSEFRLPPYETERGPAPRAVRTTIMEEARTLKEWRLYVKCDENIRRSMLAKLIMRELGLRKSTRAEEVVDWDVYGDSMTVSNHSTRGRLMR